MTEEPSAKIEKYYTVAEVAKLLSIKPATVRVWLTTEQIAGIIINGHWRVGESALQNFITERYEAGKLRLKED